MSWFESWQKQKIINLLQCVQANSGTHPDRNQWEPGSLFLRASRSAREADPSSPSRAHAKNEWSYTSMACTGKIYLLSIRVSKILIIIRWWFSKSRPRASKETQRPVHCEIAGHHRGWTEFIRLLGYYEAYGGLKPMFRDYLSVPFLWPLKMGPIGSHETSVPRHLTPRNNPEDGRTKRQRKSGEYAAVTRARRLKYAALKTQNSLPWMPYILLAIKISSVFN